MGLIIIIILVVIVIIIVCDIVTSEQNLEVSTSGL